MSPPDADTVSEPLLCPEDGIKTSDSGAESCDSSDSREEEKKEEEETKPEQEVSREHPHRSVRAGGEKQASDWPVRILESSEKWLSERCHLLLQPLSSKP